MRVDLGWSDFVVTDAEPVDAPGIARIHVRAWRCGYRGLVPDRILDSLSVTDREGRWRQILRSRESKTDTLVARDHSGEIVGFVSRAWPSRDDDAGADVGEVTALYVEPSRWRSGAGRALLHETLSRLSRAGAREVTVWVLAGNDAGITFYERFGFHADARVEIHEPTGQAQRRFRVRLADAGRASERR